MVSTRAPTVGRSMANVAFEIVMPWVVGLAFRGSPPR